MARVTPVLLFALGLWGCNETSGKSAVGAGLEYVVTQATVDAERPYYHDFGRVSDGTVVNHTFELRNDGDAPIMIMDIVPACGCTVPSVQYVGDDGQPVLGKAVRHADGKVLSVPPGKVAEIALRIDTGSIHTKNNDQLHTTRITTDSDVTPYMTLETHIFVEHPFQVVPERLTLGRVAVSGGGSGSVDIVPIAGYGVEPKELGPLPDGITAELRAEVRLERQLWILDARLEPPLEAGAVAETIVVLTQNEDGSDGEPLEIPLTANAVADVQPTPARLILIGRAGAAAPPFASVEIGSLLPGHRLRITEAVLPAEHRDRLEVEFTPRDGDGGGRSGTWDLTLRALVTALDEPLKGEVRVLFDDPQAEEVRVPYVVHAG